MWAKRIRQQSWQFPQGGIRAGETPEQAMFRELQEEVGLLPEHVEIIGSTRGWLRYRLPARLVRRHRKPTCIGQKQIWFLLRLRGCESDVCLDGTDQPEFDHWRWVDYWYPMFAVVSFKRQVYRRALMELAPLLFPEGHAKAEPPLSVGARSPKHGSADHDQGGQGNQSKNRSQERRSRLLKGQPYSSSHNR